jgi:iron complex outermembrane receptor protein
MKNFARATLGTFLLSAAWTGAMAQQAGPQPAEPTTAQDAATTGDDTTEGDNRDVIITGSRTPRAVDKIPGAVTIVTPAEVQRSLALTEDNTAVLAKTVPGYSESNQTLNTLGETLRGRATLYLFDGIPQSTPLRDGSRNATFTDMSIVERIEVISGASASEGIGAAGARRAKVSTPISAGDLARSSRMIAASGASRAMSPIKAAASTCSPPPPM